MRGRGGEELLGVSDGKGSLQIWDAPFLERL